MISLIEIATRAYSGPRMTEKEWNLGMFAKMQQLVKEHKLAHSGPELYFEVEENYVDAAWKAAVRFLVEQGVYCITTNRVIKLTEEEVLEAARAAPGEIVIGEGRDARTIRKRDIKDRRQVNVISGGHSPWPQNLASMVQTSFARVNRGDMIEGFNLAQVDDREVHGLPMAVYAAKREMAVMRDALRKAGRPGMAITFYPILTSAGPMIAPMDPDAGLRRTDGILLSILPDLKVEADYIAAAIAYEEYGGYKVNGGCFSVVGGFCGGVEGAIIEVIAKALAAWICYRDQMQYTVHIAGPGGLLPRWEAAMEKGSAEARRGAGIWPIYVANRALAKNTNIIRFGALERSPGVGGIGAETSLLYIAGDAMASTVLGCNLPCIAGNSPTPYFVEFRVRVSDATVRADIKRKEVGEMLQGIDKAIKERIRGRVADYGDRRMLAYKDFQKYFEPIKELYDFTNQQPSPTLIKNGEKAIKVLEDIGLKFR